MSVQSEIDRINGAKSTIAANIKDSGVSVQEGARLEVLAPLVGDIVGQFSDELDMIIGGDTTPVTDITARLSAVNGVSGDVSTQLDTLDGTKTAIKDAIVAKGVDIPDGTVFRDYAAKIGEIETSGGTASVRVTTKKVPVMYKAYFLNKDNTVEVITNNGFGSLFSFEAMINSIFVIAVSQGGSPTESENIINLNVISNDTQVFQVKGDGSITYA